MSYTPTIGLEIHAELKTRTKMFCNSKNDPHAAEPNSHICPVCMAFPGTLPVINKEAVKHVLTVGAALDATLADYTEFDRKNYFYPDIPKGFQISQYKYPLVSNGSLVDVDITRVHLEEDTARSQHAGGNFSLIDFNRAGVPLMELVTEPVIHDAETAVMFAKELQLLLRTLGVSDANMEKGEMRVEANISVSKIDSFGTKVEVKNLNSFKAVGDAIRFEIDRQIELLESGGQVVQETRGWDENKGKTFSQRLKEGSADYRYFPEPDLPKLKISRIAEFALENLKKLLPILPKEKRENYKALKLKSDDIEMLVSDFKFGSFFDKEVVDNNPSAEIVAISANYLLSDVKGSNPTDEELARLEGGVFLEIMNMIASGDLSSRGAKDLIIHMLKNGGNPKVVAEEKGLIQVNDTESLRVTVKEVIDENKEVSDQVKNGKVEAIQFLVGQVMKKTKGSANPGEVQKIFKEELGI